MDRSFSVEGGTAWAVQMYIDRFTCDSEDINTCKLYFFNEISRKWMSWHGAWGVLYELPPVPEGIWTGIGTRKLTIDGNNQIENVTTKRANCTV
jgi:hypothetical protein